MITLYRSTGERVGFVKNNILFSNDGVSIGYVKGNDVFLNDGVYMGRLLHFGDRYMVLRQKAVIGVKGVSKISEVSFLPVLPNTVKLTKVILPVGWQDAL